MRSLQIYSAQPEEQPEPRAKDDVVDSDSDSEMFAIVHRLTFRGQLCIQIL